MDKEKHSRSKQSAQFDTVGGDKGHLSRRISHLILAIIPFIYYWFGTDIASFVFLTREQLIGLILYIGLVFEALRLWRGVIIYSQRSYEAKQLSAAAWSGIGIATVLIFAPHIGVRGAGIGAPLIISMSWADPVMGELRLRGTSKSIIIISGLIAVSLIWIACAIGLDTPAWLIPLIAPVIVAAELPTWRWFDDNGTMLLIPLSVIFLLRYLFNG